MATVRESVAAALAQVKKDFPKPDHDARVVIDYLTACEERFKKLYPPPAEVKK